MLPFLIFFVMLPIFAHASPLYFYLPLMFNDHFIELTIFLHTTVVILKILTAEVKKNRGGGGRSFVGGGSEFDIENFWSERGVGV